MVSAMRDMLGHAAIDWLPSVAVACLVIAGVHLAMLILRNAQPQSPAAESSVNEQAALMDSPVSKEPPVMEHQATLDSATSLERKDMMASPPSTNAPKDLDLSEIATRLSSNVSTAGILAPRTSSTSQYDQALSKFQADLRAQLNQAGSSSCSEVSDRTQAQQERQADLQPAAPRRVRLPGAGPTCNRSGSEPPAFTPSSPATAAQNAYLMSISDDFVAPLKLKEGNHPSSKSVQATEATAAGQEKQKLEPVNSVPEEGSVAVSHSSSAMSTDDIPSASASTRAASAATPEPAAAVDSASSAASSSKPAARIDIGAIRQQLQQQQLAQQQQAAGDSSVRKHQLLAAGTSSSPDAAGDSTAAPDVRNAADVRPRRPSALYTSPMQHITVSVKVPNAFAPATARSLQSVVAQHVVSAAAAQQPPQHTIMHMVAVPGCIQLLIDVVNYQQAVRPAGAVPAAPAAAAEASTSAGLSVVTNLRDSVQSLYADALSEVSPDSEHEFLLTSHGSDAASANLSAHTAGGTDMFAAHPSHAAVSSAAAAARTAAGYTAEAAPAPLWMVTAVCNAVQEFMQAHAMDNTAAEINHAEAGTAVATSSHSADDQQLMSMHAGSASAEARLPILQSHPDSTAAVIIINGVKYRLLPEASSPGKPWQLHAIDPAAEGHTDNCSSSSSLNGVGAAEWMRGATGYTSRSLLPSIITTAAGVAAAEDHDDDDADRTVDPDHDGRKWPLPDDIWAWPLCLELVEGDNHGLSMWQPAASTGSSVVQIHGLTGDSVRIVVSGGGGGVAADCICQLSNGIARMTPAASNTMSRCTLYCITQSSTAATASHTAAATTRAEAEPLELATVQFALPVLYLPASVVNELHEAARKIMLEQSRARWLLQQMAAPGTEPAAEYYYCYLTDTLPDGGVSSSGGGSADATAEVGVCDYDLAAAAAARYGAGSSGIGSRHVGSFTTMRSPRPLTAGAAAAAGWDTIVPERLDGGQQQQHSRQQQQQQGASSAGANGSGHGSNSSKLTEEDAVHSVSLRGRLFDGVDVRQLLQEQFLAVLSDLGLLIDPISGPSAVAAAAVNSGSRLGGPLSLTSPNADLAVPGTSIPAIAAAGGGVGGRERMDVPRMMAAAVGEQLLVWAGGYSCWSCCQLVLSMLLNLGVELVLQDKVMTQQHINTVADVQALLLGCPVVNDAAAAALGQTLEIVALDPADDVAVAAECFGTPAAAAAAMNVLDQGEVAALSLPQAAAAARQHPAHARASVATTVASIEQQQKMHDALEGRMNNAAAVSSSDVALHQWHSTANAARRGRVSARAADQTRASAAAAAAAAAIAGNMPGSAALGYKRNNAFSSGDDSSDSVKCSPNAPAATAAAAQFPASSIGSNLGITPVVCGAFGGCVTTGTQLGLASASSMPIPSLGCSIATLPSVGDHERSAAAAAAAAAAGVSTDVSVADQQVPAGRGSRKLRLSIKDSASEMIHRLMRRKLSPGEHKDEHSAQLGELSHAAAASHH